MPVTFNTATVTLESLEAPVERFAMRFPSGAVIMTEPTSTAEVAHPVDTVLGALGACAAMDVIGILRKKRQDVHGYEVAVRGERRAEYPRLFTRIEIVHRVRGRDLSPAAIEDAIRLSDTKYCSVHAMLEGTAEIVSRFEIDPA
jgi:putative redox protein